MLLYFFIAVDIGSAAERKFCLIFIQYFLFVHVSANMKALCVFTALVYREDWRFGVERMSRRILRQ